MPDIISLSRKLYTVNKAVSLSVIWKPWKSIAWFSTVVELPSVEVGEVHLHVGDDGICLVQQQHCSLSIPASVEFSRPQRQNRVPEVRLNGEIHGLAILRSVPDQPPTPVKDQRPGRRDIRSARREKEVAGGRVLGEWVKVEDWTDVSCVLADTKCFRSQLSRMSVERLRGVVTHRSVAIRIRVVDIRPRRRQ